MEVVHVFGMEGLQVVSGRQHQADEVEITYRSQSQPDSAAAGSVVDIFIAYHRSCMLADGGAPRRDVDEELARRGRRQHSSVDFDSPDEFEIAFHEWQKTKQAGADIKLVFEDGHDLKGQPLNHREVRQKDAPTPWLVGARLEGIKLNRVHLEGSNLRFAHLERSDFGAPGYYSLQGSNLRQAHLEDSFISLAHMEGSNLHGAHLEGLKAYNVSFQGCNFDGVHAGPSRTGRRTWFEYSQFTPVTQGIRDSLPKVKGQEPAGVLLEETRFLKLGNPTRFGGVPVSFFRADLNCCDFTRAEFQMNFKGQRHNFLEATFVGTVLTHAQFDADDLTLLTFKPPKRREAAHPSALASHAKAVGGSVASGLYQGGGDGRRRRRRGGGGGGGGRRRRQQTRRVAPGQALATPGRLRREC